MVSNIHSEENGEQGIFSTIGFFSAFADLGIEPPSPMPLQQAFLPELRYVSIKLSVGVAWILTFFEDLQRHSQLERLTISGDIKAGGKDSLPRVAVLRRWLALTKSSTFTFQMKFGMYHGLDGGEHSDDLYAEYREATGIESTANYEKVNLRYPEMSLSYPMMINAMDSEDTDSDKSSNCVSDEPIDENCQEVRK